MHRILFVVAVFAIALGAWYFAWRGIMASDVAQVEATIEYHYRAIKEQTPTATFKADGVKATGFPFGFRVLVHRPTLTQVWGKESYAVSFEWMELERKNATDYRVIAPNTFDAMYAIEGAAPEKYALNASELPSILLRAEGEEDPLLRFAAQMPKKLVLDVSLNGQTKQIGFDFLSVPIPFFTPLPTNVSYPLQIFVGMLREAMVFSGQEV